MVFMLCCSILKTCKASRLSCFVFRQNIVASYFSINVMISMFSFMFSMVLVVMIVCLRAC